MNFIQIILLSFLAITPIAQALNPNRFIVAAAALGAGYFSHKNNAYCLGGTPRTSYQETCSTCAASYLSPCSLSQKEDQRLLTAFIHLKALMGVEEIVKIAYSNSKETIGVSTKSQNCPLHQEHFIIALNKDVFKTRIEQDFVIAHEFAHIKQRHLDEEKNFFETQSRKTEEFLRSCSKPHYEAWLAIAHKAEARLISPRRYRAASKIPLAALDRCEKEAYVRSSNSMIQEGSAFKREQEYEADKIAALTLKDITGGMTALGAFRDKKSINGWQLPPENKDCLSENEGSETHPSNAKRCRALLDLETQHPEVLKSSLWERFKRWLPG